MKKSRFSEEKIIAVLKQAEAGVNVSELVRKHAWLRMDNDPELISEELGK